MSIKERIEKRIRVEDDEVYYAENLVEGYYVNICVNIEKQGYCDIQLDSFEDDMRVILFDIINKYYNNLFEKLGETNKEFLKNEKLAYKHKVAIIDELETTKDCASFIEEYLYKLSEILNKFEQLDNIETVLDSSNGNIVWFEYIDTFDVEKSAIDFKKLLSLADDLPNINCHIVPHIIMLGSFCYTLSDDRFINYIKNK